MTDVVASPAEPVQAIAVTGADGVGKTGVALNLAVALSNRGRRVMLLDAFSGDGNVTERLALEARFGLGDVVRGTCALEDILLEGPSGVVVVPSSVNSDLGASLTAGQAAGLIAAFSDLSHPPETLVVDTGEGMSAGTHRLVEAAGEILVVVGPSSGDVERARSQIRRIRRDSDHERYRVLANRVSGEEQGRAVQERLARVTEQDIDVALHDVGCIPEDPAMDLAMVRHQPVVNAFPTASATRAFKRLARRTESWATPPSPGGLAFFIERMIARDSNVYRTAVVC